jgi:hypothetical protein
MEHRQLVGGGNRRRQNLTLQPVLRFFFFFFFFFFSVVHVEVLLRAVELVVQCGKGHGTPCSFLLMDGRESEWMEVCSGGGNGDDGQTRML